jgi:hypothetical protein
MEYVGARKIAKSLPASLARADHFEHFMEEARHATLLQRQSEKILEGKKVDAKREIPAEKYLQEVDHGIETCLKEALGQSEAFLCYQVVSLIIEERAMKFYPLYLRLLKEILGDHPITGTVYSILQDEVGHLEDMGVSCQKQFQEIPELLEKCRQIEEKSYQKYFWPVIEKLAQGISI